MKILRASFELKGLSSKTGRSPVTVSMEAGSSPPESIVILLELEGGGLAEGECIALQDGPGGRDPQFDARRYLPLLEDIVAPLLEGKNARDFLKNSRFFDELKIEGRRLHSGIRCGLSQALLNARAIVMNSSALRELAVQLDLPVRKEPIPLASLLPVVDVERVKQSINEGCSLFSSDGFASGVAELGSRGESLLDYVKKLSQHVICLRDSIEYRPSIYINTGGTIGRLFDNRVSDIANYMAELAEVAAPFKLFIGDPICAGVRQQQINRLSLIKERLRRMGSVVGIVADQWCNTFDDVKQFVDADCCDMALLKPSDLGGLHNTVHAVRYCESMGVQSCIEGKNIQGRIFANTCLQVAYAARSSYLMVDSGLLDDVAIKVLGERCEYGQKKGGLASTYVSEQAGLHLRPRKAGTMLAEYY